MADENNQEVKKSGGKGLLIALIVVIVLLIAVIGGGAYYVISSGMLNQQPQDQQAQAEKEKVKKEEAGDGEEFQADINDLVLNITNAKGNEKLMKLSFSIKSVEPTIAAIVEQNKAEIVDVVIAQVSSRSSEELLTVGGKNLLKEELVEEINKIVNNATSDNKDVKQNNVKKVLFTALVIK